MKYPLLIVLLAMGLYAQARGPWAVTNIQPALLKDANAVVRLYEREVVLKGLEKMSIRTHYIITILNERADELAELTEMYDRFNGIESVAGILYDQNGDQIRSLKKSEIKDVSLVSETDIAGDARLKTHNFYCRNYPYTIEYTVETTKKETMFFPQWMPVPQDLVGVEKSVMSVDVPAGYELRFRMFNYSQPPDTATRDGRTIYRWTVSGYLPVKREYAAPSWRNITPLVAIAPSAFVIEGYEGSMNDWRSLGYFQSSLNKGRDVLPPAAKEIVHALTKDLNGVREKVEKLYNYLQNNTRYVSIQLGVGGWQPFDAKCVSSKKYGDCKALSNYMCAMLREAGIPAYYTLIRAGEHAGDIITDFPSRQFNHVIVCVPDGRDTIWLECTSQTTAAGYMGSFTGNRHALLITEDGGKLVETPRYGMSDNLQSRHIKARLAEDGTLAMNVVTRYACLRQDDIHGLINNLSQDRVKEYLHAQIDFPSYEIRRFDYSQDRATRPSVTETLDITVSNYAVATGRRLFIIPNIMTRSDRKLTQDGERKFDIQIDDEFTDRDTVEIEIPAGYTAEVIPADVNAETAFGFYTNSVKLEGQRLVYTRRLDMKGGLYPAKDFPELSRFYETVFKGDRNRVVLVKKE